MSTNQGELNEERAAVPVELRLASGTPKLVVGADGQPAQLAVRICTPRLEWRAGAGNALWTEGALTAECLWSFIRLDDATDEQILIFARQHGVLGICHHGLPVLHDDCPAQRISYGPTDEWCWEELARWRMLARQLGTMLRIYHHLRHGRPVPAADWSMLRRVLDQPAPAPGTDEWSRFSSYASYLIDLAHLTVRPRLFGGVTLVAVDSGWPAGMLFRVLVIQLAGAICGVSEVALCDGCGHAYGSARKQRVDRSSDCAWCRPAAVRRIKRESPQRHKDRYMRQAAARKAGGAAGG